MREWQYIIYDTRNRKYGVNLDSLEEVWYQIVIYLKSKHLLNILDNGYFNKTSTMHGEMVKSYIIDNNIPPFRIRINKLTTGEIDMVDFIETRNRIINKHTD